MWIAWLLGAIGVGVFIMSKDASASETTNNLKPSKWDDLFKKYAAENGIDWRLMKTIAMNESSLGTNSRVLNGLNNPYDIGASTSTDGLSWGLMQMTVTTARDFDKSADAVKLNDAEYSIRLSAKFIKSLYNQFPGNINDVIMAYNHGAGNQRKFIAAGRPSAQYKAGQDYLAKYQKNYKYLWG